MSKQWFASQVDVNKNLSKPVTQHYLPKKTESAFVKPDHMIASSSSRNSSKNMPRFSLNDMVHNHYLDVAKRKIQERDRNSTTSVTTSARFQSTVDDSKPKIRSNNQTSRSLPVSTSTRVTITVVPKADHSKSSSSYLDSKNFVCSTCHKCVFNANHDACITKLLKEIFTGHRFSPNKTSAVYEKTSPRSDLSVDSEHTTWVQNVDIPNIHECKQTLDVSAGKSQSMVAEKADISETIVKVDSQMMIQKNDSFAVTTTDASNKRQQQPDSTSSTSTLATTVTANGNFDLLGYFLPPRAVNDDGSVMYHAPYCYIHDWYKVNPSSRRCERKLQTLYADTRSLMARANSVDPDKIPYYVMWNISVWSKDHPDAFKWIEANGQWLYDNFDHCVVETSDDDDDARSLWSSDDDEHFDPFEDDPTHPDARWSP
ncbi:hypothetical protein Tco_0250535 [Tanacetum coccineum]